MRNTLFAALTALALLPAPARARVDLNVRLNLGLPVTPPLVVVQPGVQVVEDFDDEVFFVNGVYWARRDGRWYTARAPRAAFVVVEPRRVPAVLVKIPPGHYRRWRAPRPAARVEEGHDRHHGKAKGHDHH